MLAYGPKVREIQFRNARRWIAHRFTSTMRFIALLALMVCLSCRFTARSNQNVVTIAYLPVVQALPLYVAVAEGYFTTAGIVVQLVRFESPNQIIDALLQNRADVGAPGTASGITAVAEAAKPGSLKLFALVGGDLSTRNDELLVRSDSSIQAIDDLRGKSLGILPGIQFRTIAQYILNKNGLSGTDVRIVEIGLPLQVQALASKQVDALLTLEPVGTIAMSQRVARDLVRAPMVRYISNPWYGADGVVTTQFVRQRPETARTVVAIFVKAMTNVKTNPDGSRHYLWGYTPLPQDLIAQVPLPIFKAYSQFDSKDLEALQDFFAIFLNAHVITKSVDVKQLVYSPE
jgi:NitT/TauT family transport system substrate-binding protein